MNITNMTKIIKTTCITDIKEPKRITSGILLTIRQWLEVKSCAGICVSEMFSLEGNITCTLTVKHGFHKNKPLDYNNSNIPIWQMLTLFLCI